VQEQIAIKIILVSSSRYRYSKGKESVISFVKQRMMLMGLRRFTKYTICQILLH
jgi:hypothetical protein